MEVTIGGERLGAGKKMKAYLNNYERSTHDLGFVWRSTMAAGTLVPFMTEVGLPGDTFDIDLNCDVLTHPTIGPLFGTYKIQLDVFLAPVRLYQAQLHMNMLNIGRDMSQILLPQIFVEGTNPDPQKDIDNQQINPSSILKYLGISGVGVNATNEAAPSTTRSFNGIPLIAYWDIYKNYYANKQEEIGAVIHKKLTTTPFNFTAATINLSLPQISIPVIPPVLYNDTICLDISRIQITSSSQPAEFDPALLFFNIKFNQTGEEVVLPGTDLFEIWEYNQASGVITGTKPKLIAKTNLGWGLVQYYAGVIPPNYDLEPEISYFPLENIDKVRQGILQWDPTIGAYTIGRGLSSPTQYEPYSLLFERVDNPESPGFYLWSQQYAQEGLGLKTYNSDLFNNWISTDWIDGPDGISAVTAIDTSGGSFTIDELNLSKKIYDMLNRIAISGGTYDDWLDAVYTHQRTRSAENPMYLGGLIKNLVFQEVISNSASEGEPLGTLAGRGTIGQKHKGGKIVVKVDEPSYIMGIVSITPNVDYSQGNKWDVNLATMNDFHKPALDQIGFQDLITDQMAWWDTQVDVGVNIFKSAGKQPAWINYMTNVNKVYGNFADQAQQMFMVLNRRYGVEYDPVVGVTIRDLTTYIDPSKFNHIFADTRRDAQNFWTQIGVNITARRKMSAKIIPNL